MDHLTEALLRSLLRVALRTADGDPAAALRLAVDTADHDPDLSVALRECLGTAAWGRLVREELTGRR